MSGQGTLSRPHEQRGGDRQILRGAKHLEILEWKGPLSLCLNIELFDLIQNLAEGKHE
jgi:hypothetical protein